ncbi:MAG: hypothetical protein AAB198_07485 [Actinomycetota bacterium]
MGNIGGCDSCWYPASGVRHPPPQVTYNGWPLYRYSPDNEPVDANGQGAGGNWWVVDADGEPIM